MSTAPVDRLSDLGYFRGMTLEDYRLKCGLTRAELAKSLRIAPETLRRYVRGRVPEPFVMRKIIALTKGAVTANDFYERARA